MSAGGSGIDPGEWAVQNRDTPRASLLARVKGALAVQDVAAMVPAMVVLYLRELDGDEVLERAARSLREAGGDFTGLRTKVVWWAKHTRLTQDEDP